MPGWFAQSRLPCHCWSYAFFTATLKVNYSPVACSLLWVAAKHRLLMVASYAWVQPFKVLVFSRSWPGSTYPCLWSLLISCNFTLYPRGAERCHLYSFPFWCTTPDDFLPLSHNAFAETLCCLHVILSLLNGVGFLIVIRLGRRIRYFAHTPGVVVSRGLSPRRTTSDICASYVVLARRYDVYSKLGLCCSP